MLLCVMFLRSGFKSVTHFDLCYPLNLPFFQVRAHCASLRLGIDLRLLHVLVEHKDVPVSAAQLAELSKAEYLQIGT